MIALAPTPTVALCRHCHQRERYKGHRGLCNGCYYSPGIRSQYPAQAKYARRGPGANGRDPLPAVVVEWIVIETASARLGVTEGAVKRLVRRGLIRHEFRAPGIRDARRLTSRILWLWWADVQALMEQHADARRPDPLHGLTRVDHQKIGDRRQLTDPDYAGPADPPVLYGLLTAADVAALAKRRARFDQIRARIPLPVIEIPVPKGTTP